jgi:ADP-heptose:LPS heptosyltransferase
MRKVYFGNLGQFGDVAMQEPALRQFIKDNPTDKITLGCSLKYAEAMRLFDDYHENVTVRKLFLDYHNFPTQDDVKYFQNEKFDLVTIKNNSDDIQLSDKGKIALHPDKNWAQSVHQTVAAGRQQGIEVTDTQIKFNTKFDLKLNERYICFSLFPNYPNPGPKSLSREQIIGIVKLIKKLGYKAVHLNGPNEPDIEGTIKANCSWINSVALVTNSELLISGDTGMAWAASGFQHPTVGLYAWGYNPVAGTSKNWQPTNPNATYIEAHSAQQIQPIDIISKVVETLRRNK